MLHSVNQTSLKVQLGDTLFRYSLRRSETASATTTGILELERKSIPILISIETTTMVFGQVVIGPPGSGKNTYCNGMSQFFKLIGSYKCAVNIKDLIKLSDVMTEHSLGPNGGLVYCVDYLEKNINWLQLKLEPLLKDHYLLFDFPGQVELFFLHSNAKNVVMKLIKKLDLRVCLHVFHVIGDSGKYVIALLLSLSTMLHLKLPHINILSKIDLIENYGNLAFNLDFYTNVQDLSYLQHHLDQDPRSAKYRFVIETFHFSQCMRHEYFFDKESVGNLVKLIDKSNGYIFVFTAAAVQEKYMKDDEDFDNGDAGQCLFDGITCTELPTFQSNGFCNPYDDNVIRVTTDDMVLTFEDFLYST
ncbi:GPN-loop GTPase 2-like isoform X7 [Hibiscus syriacus]|uniref:GPN-loop GTPase 2 n=1 Tax=Hibiscus syriacus TaxID=106335 RepID=A0A6A2ZVU4_HIBSY|nr:GPN-loop GTPase 2-like isoform X7 [Hibiscus syriacus]